MLKSESLIQLVNNLTKQEKKEFSLYITNLSSTYKCNFLGADNKQ